jgi:predicted transcriptional regulator
MSAKVQAIDLIRNLPEDSTYEDIIEELCFRARVEEGLCDERDGRLVSHEEFKRQSRQWPSK